MTSLPVLRVNQAGEFVRHQSCARRFRLELNGRDAARRLPFYNRLFNPLDPVLQAEGARREEQWASMLESDGLQKLAEPTDGEYGVPWSVFCEKVSELNVGQTGFAQEVEVTGSVGGFQIEGRIDFALVLWDNYTPTLRIVECKASRRDKTYQRLQVALYKALVCKSIESKSLVIAGTPIEPSHVSAVVARIDQDNNSLQSISDLPPLALDTEGEDLEALLAPNGPLAQYAQADLDDLPYQLNSKCDTCIFNTDCLPESGLHRRPQLIGLPPASIRALKRVGVASLDELAELDPKGDTATSLRTDPAFGESIDSMIVKAKARLSTLPGDSDEYPVQQVPNSGLSGLPEHEQSGQRLVRVYLSVDYDYAEDRIGGLSAHVTQSDSLCHTGFVEETTGWKPYPRVVETPKDWTADGGPAINELPDISGQSVINFKNSPWTGNYIDDTRIEGERLEAFLIELIDAIDAVSDAPSVPIHFYVWSRTEMRRLVEACSRTNTALLGHLRELLGCRDSLEQLIFSALQEEVTRRYGLGWTGRGLAVATALTWFGKRYHWTRDVGRDVVALDKVMEQDIFDFKTTLRVTDDGRWADPSDTSSGSMRLFEVRSRFFDQLPAPYWRAVWGELDPNSARDASTRNAIERYNRAQQPNYLRSYLRSRCHALRWIDERIQFHNREITKPPLNIAQLRNFRLGTRDLGDACVDFLRLDQHVKASDWAAAHLAPPHIRVSAFVSLPITNIQATGNNEFTAELDVASYGTTLAVLAENSRFAEGGFARLTPRPDPIDQPQSLGLLQKHGASCVINQLDWATGAIRLAVIPLRRSDQFRLSTVDPDPDNEIWSNATLDESPSGFVEHRVHQRLDSRSGDHVFRWFNPTAPQLPALPQRDPETVSLANQVLDNLGPAGVSILNESQLAAAKATLHPRVQLIQGPPGTGKTRTAAVCLALHALLLHESGSTLLVGGTTHTSVDTLLEKTAEYLPIVQQQLEAASYQCPQVTLCRIDPKDALPAGVASWGVGNNFATTPMVQATRSGSLVLFGTTTGLLKGSANLINAARFQPSGNSFASGLFIDEASMMKLPEFLSLASVTQPTATLLLAGDHRQLAPIVSHDWEKEDRPPTVLYKPYVSAYDAVQALATEAKLPATAVTYSHLEYSHRLPPAVRDLIARVYRLDSIDLDGPVREPVPIHEADDPLSEIWSAPHGVYLLVHDERESRRSNRFEAEILAQLLAAGNELPDSSVAVITPHRAQRTLLQQRLEPFSSAVSVIDTVERLQGGECSSVIVSATASDPTAISTNADFLLDLNRANVAFSRAQDRLIVVCSRSLLDHVPDDLDQYTSAMLWKALRSLCSRQLGVVEFGGQIAHVMCPPTPSVSHP